MHAISFAFKRGHLRMVAFGKRLVEGVAGMTPARFDLLCLIRQSHLWRGSDPKSSEQALEMGVAQREIWDRLDLCRTTVSKMLRRLEEMGWVQRSPHPRIKRTKLVRLTALGLRAIAKAMRTVFRQRGLLRYFERLARERWKGKHVVHALADCWEDLEFFAAAFGDRSDINYDFGPRYDPIWDVPYTPNRPYDPSYEPLPPRRKIEKPGPRYEVRLPELPFI